MILSSMLCKDIFKCSILEVMPGWEMTVASILVWEMDIIH